jgi:uncharacterized membrane protein (UPF0127 family)
MKRVLISLALVLVSISAWADESIPLLYTRSAIVINRTHVAAVALPWQSAEDASAAAKLPINVEVRDASTLYSQSGWYNLSGPSEQDGVLLVFSSPTLAPIINSAQYAPLDVLMIDDKGIITGILPRLMMSEITEEIYPKKPILAFLFLKGGSCEAFSISPGDEIDYKIFKKPPTMLTAPENTPAATPKPLAAPAKP